MIEGRKKMAGDYRVERKCSWFLGGGKGKKKKGGGGEDGSSRLHLPASLFDMYGGGSMTSRRYSDRW